MPSAELAVLAKGFLDSQSVPEAASQALRAIAAGRDLDRKTFDQVVGPTSPQAERAFAEFTLHVVRVYLTDHVLSTDEKSELRYLQRLFRLEEGRLLELAPEAVGAVVAAEMTRILQDRTVDPQEALHQVDVQEVLGLGYDQYLKLARPQVYKVLLHLAARIDPDQDGVVRADDLNWYFGQLAGLDTVFDLNPESSLTGPAPGYLYVLVNPSMPGIVKIGKTTRSPVIRAKEIGATTGVPTPFLLVFDAPMHDCAKAEAYVHNKLEARGLRVAGNREFFRLTPSEAISMVQEAQVATAAA